MKRLLGIAIVAAIMLGVPAAHYLINPAQDSSQITELAKKKKKKTKKKAKKKKAPRDVTLCHIPGNPEVVNGLMIGWTTEVPERAVKGHLAHGDCLEYEEIGPDDECGCPVE